MKNPTTKNTKITEETEMKNLNNQPTETTNTFIQEDYEMKTFINLFNDFMEKERIKLGLTEEEFEQMLEEELHDEYDCSTCKNRDCINCDHFNSILK